RMEDTRRPVPIGPGSDETVLPPALDHYFLVSFEGRMFQVGISADKKRVVDVIPAFDAATAGTAAPDNFAFNCQMPLFRLGGATGSAIQIDLKGRDLDAVSTAAGATFGALMGHFGPRTLRPEPANFAYPLDELRIVPNDERLRELGMTRSD